MWDGERGWDSFEGSSEGDLDGVGNLGDNDGIERVHTARCDLEERRAISAGWGFAQRSRVQPGGEMETLASADSVGGEDRWCALRA